MEKMGDTTDGSSNAAQSAQQNIGDETQMGFFSRVFKALSPKTSAPEQEDQPISISPQAAQTLGLLNLRRMRVEDVMVPKADIVAVSKNIESDELVKVFRDCGLTRLPVFDGTLDTPIGFVNLKDFALKHGFSKTKGGYELQALVRPLLYVPPSMQLGILLQKMQTERTHMALVIDEYGGTDGLVTIEDLIEQVVGAIEDEHDHEEVKSWVREAPGVYLARAKTGLDDFEAEIGMALTAHDEIDEEDVDTLGGLVFMLSGHVPVRGEVIQHPDGVEFEVLDADPRKIKRLRVRLPQSKDA